MVIRQQIVQTDGFKKMIKKTFEKIDLDKDGRIDREELMAASYEMYYKVGEKFPGLVAKPTKESVSELLAKCDLDASGSLSLDEFELYATSWFEKCSVMFGTRLLVTSTLSMVVLPGAASIVYETVKPVGFGIIPKTVFKVLFGMAYKVAVLALKKPKD